MALSWKSQEKNIESVKTVILSLIAKQPIPAATKLNWEGNELCIRIEHGGTSELRLTIKETTDGVCIVETKRELAFLHRAFAGIVESAIDKVLAHAGFSKS